MPTALDVLNSLLTDAEKAQFTTLLKNPKFAEKVGTGVQFLIDYAEPDAPDAAAAAAEAERVRLAAAAEATRRAAAAASTPPAAAATSASATLDDIGRLLDTKLGEMKKEFIPVADLDKHRTSILASAIRSAHEVANIEATHKSEFGEGLDLEKLNKYAEEHPGAYKNITETYNAMVSDKRIEKKIADGIAEGIKLKTSGTTVPAQTTSTALSPAQEIIRKAKTAEASGESNVSRAAAKLSRILKEREGADAAA